MALINTYVLDIMKCLVFCSDFISYLTSNMLLVCFIDPIKFLVTSLRSKATVSGEETINILINFGMSRCCPFVCLRDTYLSWEFNHKIMCIWKGFFVFVFGLNPGFPIFFIIGIKDSEDSRHWSLDTGLSLWKPTQAWFLTTPYALSHTHQFQM